MQDYRLEQLANGQCLITERLDHLRSIGLGFWIPVGSRDEPAGLSGVTHFIEHLLFKGSQKYSAEQIAQIFDTLGGELNAATSKEYVVVYARFLDEHLPVALDVLVDMLRAPRFSDLDREREVVLEEIAMYEDTPQDLIHDLLMEAVFGDHPLGHSVLGARDVVASVSEKQVREYHGCHFRFSDMVVAAAGSVDHDQLGELLLAEHGQPDCASPQGQRGSANPQRTPVRAAVSPRRRFVQKETEQMHICYGGEGIARNDPRRYVLSVTDSLLGGSLSSRLFQEVREKRGLVYNIYSFFNMYRETGLCGIYFGCRPERLVQVVQIVSNELARLGNEAVAQEELFRAKEHLKGRVILSLEGTSSRMTRLGKAVLTESEILTLDEIEARIEAVTAEQVMELARQLYSPSRLSVVGIGADEARFAQMIPAAADISEPVA